MGNERSRGRGVTPLKGIKMESSRIGGECHEFSKTALQSGRMTSKTSTRQHRLLKDSPIDGAKEVATTREKSIHLTRNQANCKPIGPLKGKSDIRFSFRERKIAIL